MQQQGRVLRAGRLFKTAVALLIATTLGSADVVDAGVPVNGDFIVAAEIVPGLDGGAVEFGTGWEDLTDFSVVVAEDGTVLVNGAAIGFTYGASAVRIEVFANNGSMTVAVMDAGCGSLLCLETGFAAPLADRVRASADAVLTLDVGE